MRQLLLWVPDDLHARLVSRAKRSGRSANAIATELLDLGVSDESGDARAALRARARQLGVLATAPAAPVDGAARRAALESMRGLGRSSTASWPTAADVLVYVDSSASVRAYLPDETGHEQARDLIEGGAQLLVTATWTVVEVTSALARASRERRVADLDGILAVLAADTGEDGAVTLLRADTEQVEWVSARIVRDHATRSLDALHLAVAELAAVPLLESGQQLGLATRTTPSARPPRRSDSSRSELEPPGTGCWRPRCRASSVTRLRLGLWRLGR